MLTVTWDTQGPAGAYAILLSQDNGASFANVSGNDLPGTARSFSFPLPTPTTSSVPAKVRVAAKDAPNGTRLTTADSPPFTLQQQPLSVQVIKPDLAQTLDVEATLPIAWVSTGATNQRVQFVASTGEVKPIVTGLDGAAQSFTWPIPPDFVAMGQQLSGRVRVIARSTTTGLETMDDSDVLITVRGQPALSVQVTQPNIPQTLNVGATLPMTWSSTGASTHRLQFVVPNSNGPEEILSIVSGLGSEQSFTWVIPQEFIPAGTEKTGRIRVIARNATTGQNVSDDSEVAITLRGQAQLSVQVTKPNQTQTLDVGATLPIAWSSTGAIDHQVKFVPDTGESVVLIISGLAGNVQSYTWAISQDFVAPGQQKRGRIRVIAHNANTDQQAMDDSDASISIRGMAVDREPPTVRVLSPNGGETFQPRQTVTIRWESSDNVGIVSQRIELSTNAGASYNVNIATNFPSTVQNFTCPRSRGLNAPIVFLC
jgi:hypothetical protein